MRTKDINSALRELEEENELLLNQLHLVQEELESYYLKNKELEAATFSQVSVGSTVMLNDTWVDDELPVVLAENARLKSLLNMQERVRELEAKNSLAARLTAVLSEVSNSSGKVIRVPHKLLSFWSKENNKSAPTKLGGKGHPKVLQTYNEKGMEAVVRLLEDNTLSAAQQANAWTDLARHLQDSDYQACAKAARFAYDVEPKAFRLKWLAFRLNRAGDYQQAEAILELLPENLALSISEQQSADKIRDKARQEREMEVKANVQFDARRKEVAKLLQKFESEVRDLRTERSQLLNKSELDKQELAQRSDELSKIRIELESLSIAKKEFVEIKTELEKTLNVRDGLINKLKGELQVANKNLETNKSQDYLVKEERNIQKRAVERDRIQSAEMNRLFRGVVLNEDSKSRLPFFLKIEELQVCLFLQLISQIKPFAMFDIGANVGFYTLISKKYFPDLKCYAFEPTPATFSNLLHNIERNKTVGGGEARCIALSFEKTKQEFLDFGNCSGKNSIVDTSFHHESDVSEIISVETEVLDDLFQFEGETLIAKIDVEGHEIEVLKGARKLLLANHFVLQVETGHKGESSLIDDLLISFGYHLIFRVGPDSYYSNISFLKVKERTFDILEKAIGFMINHRWDIEDKV